MSDSNTVVYEQLCVQCGKGREAGVFDYLGEGKFIHAFHGKSLEAPDKAPREYRARIKEEREGTRVTVPQCSCKWDAPNINCPLLTETDKLQWRFELNKQAPTSLFI